MRKAQVLGIMLLVISALVLGGTVFRQQVADASALLNVFVTNDSSHPVPVKEQNVDANGNIKVHEQGTADVRVTNSSLTIAPAAPITGGGSDFLVGGSGTILPFSPPVTASALSIHLSSEIESLTLTFQGNVVAEFDGPALDGNDSILLALTRPIEFDTAKCVGQSGMGTRSASWAGSLP
jgi:hypothetical protein